MSVKVFSGWCLLNRRPFCYQTWYGDATLRVGVSCRKMCLLCSRSDMTLSTIPSELRSLWPTDSVWWYVIISQIAYWTKWITVFKVRVTPNVQNVNECLSRMTRRRQYNFHFGPTQIGSLCSWAAIFLLDTNIVCVFVCVCVCVCVLARMRTFMQSRQYSHFSVFLYFWTRLCIIVS